MSTPISNSYEWYYIGHYGQLGPLSLEQIKELVRDSVIERETYIWKAGMPNWVRAGQVEELLSSFGQYQSMLPPPTPSAVTPPPSPTASSSYNDAGGASSYSTMSSGNLSSSQIPIGNVAYQPYGTDAPHDDSYYATQSNLAHYPTANYPMASLPKSDKSRVVAGVLNLIVPGIGRMYLGYMGQGIMQLLLLPFCGLGIIWSMIDGVLILTGSVKLDGYNRVLSD